MALSPNSTHGSVVRFPVKRRLTTVPKDVNSRSCLWVTEPHRQRVADGKAPKSIKRPGSMNVCSPRRTPALPKTLFLTNMNRITVRTIYNNYINNHLSEITSASRLRMLEILQITLTDPPPRGRHCRLCFRTDSGICSRLNMKSCH